jgi:hypothetical protein
MTWLRLLLAAGLAVALVGASAARQDKDKDRNTTDKKEEKKDKDRLPLGEDAWDMKVFDKEPFKLVRTSYDDKAREVRWVLEFTRNVSDPEVGSVGYWVDHASPFRVRLRDEDGVIFKTLPLTCEGEFKCLKGDRVRVVFRLPEDAVWSKVKAVLVESL